MDYKHLTEDERYHIDELLHEGFSQAVIARKLKRSPSTLSREILRNRGERGWRPRQAQAKANERLAIRGVSNVKRSSASAWAYAKKHLSEEQWSPEQIVGRRLRENLEPISHETIYKFILEDKKTGGSLYTHLRSQKIRKKRYGSAKSRRGAIPGRVDIDKRPIIVESRTRVGDWEGDTIIGSHDGGAVIASMVERKSRYVCLSMAANKTTVTVIGSINDRMRSIADLVLTVTFDNGREFCSHENLSKELEAKVYFAKPYHSWERGSNENTNGLVRQYLPKKVSFDKVSNAELMRIESKINNRPRKCLGYKTSFEVLNKLALNRGVALRI